jgi:hypothetical protein
VLEVGSFTLVEPSLLPEDWVEGPVPGPGRSSRLTLTRDGILVGLISLV